MEWLSEEAPEVAPKLLGWGFYVREPGGSLTGGIITEMEAYTADDAASHSYRGETKRNSVMFGPSGRLYVYFTYGMHWCANIVTGLDGSGQAVLIRSILPDKGLERMRQRRGGPPDTELANGPAKLCQALAITGEDNGARLDERFILVPPKNPQGITFDATPRIGIREDTHRLWRFVLRVDALPE